MQFADDFDQVGLVGHNLSDRLVGVGVFVDELLGQGVVPCPTRHRGAERLGSQLADAALRPSRRPAPSSSTGTKPRCLYRAR